MLPRTPRLLLAALLVLLVAAACGGDDDDSGGEAAATTTTAPSATTETTAAAPAGDLPPACGLVTAAELNEAGLELSEGAEIGDERRSVCAYPSVNSTGVGVTIGVEGGSRFDEKAARSEDIFGKPGEPVEGVGDRALFWFTTDEQPEGLSGVLIGKGDLTVDITLQGIADEAEARETETAIAAIAAGRL